MRDSNFLRDLVAREVIILSHFKGTTMLADILTKAVARPIFLVLMRLLDDFDSIGWPSTWSRWWVSSTRTARVLRGAVAGIVSGPLLLC